MKTTTLLALAAALALPTLAQAATSVGIENSPHDFSTNSAYSAWNTRKGVCSPCHSVHNTDVDQLIPLWNHATTKVSFTPYSNPSTLNAVVGQPNGTSLACLSCHDGSLGLNEPIGGLGTNVAYYIEEGGIIGEGGDLHTTHPISFKYDDALATADGGLENPYTYKIGDPKTRLTVSTAPVPTSWPAGAIPIVGKTIAAAMLDKDSRLQCSSCHDVHKMIGYAPGSGILTKISGNDANGRGSTLCRTCHIK